jgi:hypothetical protein
MQKVSAEWASPGRLSQQGISRDTLKPNDRLIVTGSPARNPSEYRMHVKRIERPADGWTWVGRGSAANRCLDTRRAGLRAKWQAARDADPMLYQRMADAKRLTPFAG